jgi:hypothetical protein
LQECHSCALHQLLLPGLLVCHPLLLWVCLYVPLALGWACVWAVSVHPVLPAAAVDRLQLPLVQEKPFLQTSLLLL